MMCNKKLMLTVASLIVVSSTNILALEAWNGTKSFVQFNYGQDIVPIVIEMNKKMQTASIAQGYTAGHGIYEIVQNKMTIDLAQPVENFSSSTALNPYTGQEELVATTTKLKSFTFNEIKDTTFEVLATGKSCQTFYDLNGNNREICKNISEDFNSDFFQMIKARSPKTTFKKGDKVALPLNRMNSTFVKILDGHNVQNLTNYNGQQAEIKSLEQRNTTIEAILDNGDSITYSRLAERNGDELLLGVIKDENNQLKGMATGTIVISEDVNTSALDFSGEYNVVGFGGLITAGDEFIISFFNSGFGGFDYYDAPRDMSNSTVWSWEPTNTGMKASRWMLLDENNNSSDMANTEEEIKSCINGKEKCYEFQKREYRVLAKDGNKYTMLRRMEYNSQPDNPNYKPAITYNLNYLYKK